ncbi:MAG: class D beta-lactamase [Proteobacteria bacterium]|nr:class D beta-lactamase [Pseudomonadota bacterium]
MKKGIFGFALLLFSITGYAADATDLASYFPDESGCFILYNVNENKIATEYNPTRCAEQIPPDSTFKIPLSLMAFDQKLITQKTIFSWDGVNKGLPRWNQDQTPSTWLKNSVVWVSQELTPKLGMNKIKSYLKKFNYGNQDFSGDAGQDNGLTRAWLSSSLKISGDEQLNFLKSLVADKLPVSQSAMKETKTNMYLLTSPGGWEIYGKTGSGMLMPKAGQPSNDDGKLQDGWFIGYMKRSNQAYIFVLNFSDLKTPTNTDAGGTRAKQKVQDILTKMGLF